MSRPLSSMTDSPIDATPSSLPEKKSPDNHPYVQRGPSDSRSPCPALNTLANHGYIKHSGQDIGFIELVKALHHVYNLTWSLCIFLAAVGLYISGSFTFTTRPKDPSQSDTILNRLRPIVPMPRWRIDLASLSIRGPGKIAHDASFVHPNYVESHAPNQGLLAKLLSYTTSCSSGRCRCGLSLFDMARYHQQRESELSQPLGDFQRKVALGECGLAWAVMRKRCATMDRQGSGDSANSERDDLVPHHIIQGWLGGEQLPDDWWCDGGSRPVHSIGLFEAKKRAGDVAKIIENKS
ncbi:heme-thiolate peroxidase [Leucocoprinus birnbaumii]|uniref:Heme-thiolate peroxidase n=1 Tax=Leucocoprinus birnbaumii TaxID=56174 RepID=A0AAD5YUS0_9AGAR|nr:heme-thiolate peroxidase [Leucocoprinus birnbaumii]